MGICLVVFSFLVFFNFAFGFGPFSLLLVLARFLLLRCLFETGNYVWFLFYFLVFKILLVEKKHTS